LAICSRSGAGQNVVFRAAGAPAKADDGSPISIAVGSYTERMGFVKTIRVLFLVAGVVLGGVLVGCGSPTSAPKTTTKVETKVETKTETKTDTKTDAKP